MDSQVVEQLRSQFAEIRRELPAPGGVRVYPSWTDHGPKQFLFVGVPTLRNFLYDEMREFATKVLASLSSYAPDMTSLGMTLHGPGYGLDERACLEALLTGLAFAIESGDYPRGLEAVTLAELNEGRVLRLEQYLEEFLPKLDRLSGHADEDALLDLRRAATVRDTVFIAMPFDESFEDVYYYGIEEPLHDLGLQCERMDHVHFVGDIVAEVRRRIQRSRLVIADLSTANPNVYLEVGVAWGNDVPTVLVVRDPEELVFDTRGMRCLAYRTAHQLAAALKDEVRALLGSPRS